jgi:hypothetical protein
MDQGSSLADTSLSIGAQHNNLLINQKSACKDSMGCDSQLLCIIHTHNVHTPQAGGPGLLAQALKLPGGTSLPRPLTLRAVSLSNLLDVGMTGLDQLISQPSIDPSQAQGGLPHAQSAAPALDHGRQQQQQQQHADYEVDSQVSDQVE